MVNKKGSALLMVWAEVPADKEDDFNGWYNEEHLAERLAIPGVLSAARYESDSPGAPKHLAMYELENIGVMTSDAYLSVRGNATEWTKRASPEVIGTTYIRNTYEQIFPSDVADDVAQSGDGACAANRTHDGAAGAGCGVERVVQQRLCAELHEGAGLHTRQALSRGCRRARIQHCL